MTCLNSETEWIVTTAIKIINCD